MMEAFNIILSIIIPVIITSVVSLWLGRNQGRSIKVDIEKKYQEMLNNEITARLELSKRFDALEKEARQFKEEAKRYMRAYEYSMKHIGITRVNKSIPVPDFLEWDSDKLSEYYRTYYGSEGAM